MGCRLSALRRISLAVPYPDMPGNCARTKGVFTAMLAMRSAAARIISIVTKFIVSDFTFKPRRSFGRGHATKQYRRWGGGGLVSKLKQKRGSRGRRAFGSGS